MSKMAIYCCKCSNNQSLSHFISNSPWPSTNLLKFDELAKMQSSRYWIERAFQDAKGYCGMSEYMVRAGMHGIIIWHWLCLRCLFCCRTR